MSFFLSLKTTIKKKIYLCRLKRVTDQWCNGSTPGFGSVSLGSNPGWSTLHYSHSKKWEFFLEESESGVESPSFCLKLTIIKKIKPS